MPTATAPGRPTQADNRYGADENLAATSRQGPPGDPGRTGQDGTADTQHSAAALGILQAPSVQVVNKRPNNTSDLARDLGVAYDTVRRAAVLLRERGLIITVHGRGTYVS